MVEKGRKVRSVPKNLPIIREAEVSNHIYFLVKGKAAVVVDGREVHQIKPGEFFGEIAGILGVPRTATVLAREFCDVYEFHGMSEELYEFLRDRPPQVLQAFVRGLASKLIDSSRSQGNSIRDQEIEIQRLTKALSGTLALVESLAARLKKEGTLKNEALHDIISHLKGVSGLRRGDIRNMDPKYLIYLRDVLYPKAPKKPPRTV
jgi:CRP-like cAMP-binding protein